MFADPKGERMGLADDIRLLRNRALADLHAAHDYYGDTKLAWQILRKAILSGKIVNPAKKNTVTGTVTNLGTLVVKSRNYVAVQLAESTFQQFISIFEAFFADFMRLWLQANPLSLGQKDIKFRDVLEAPDKDAITLSVVNKEINRVAYGSPKDWFEYLESRCQLGLPTEHDIQLFSEAKASRDILVHNQGVVNAIYKEKAGDVRHYAIGDRIEIPDVYHRRTLELIRKMVTDISDTAITKA
ncbi:MAG: hypothetical protein U1E05_24135 [Patescibacteria group bacterium]|nr:hypothetical protein [Patescibacteria group bacterium]